MQPSLTPSRPPPPADEPPPGSRRPARPVLAWLRLARVYQKVNRATSDALRDARISLGQFDVLVHVGAAEGSTQQQIADALLVTKSNVAQLLDRMERTGLVERRQRGRMNLLYLTTDGRQLYDRVVPDHERQIEALLSALDDDEQNRLLGLLRKLDRSLA